MADAANHWLAILWKCSSEASIVVVLIVAAQKIFGRHLAPRWRCALWLLVALRLALPWSIPIPHKFSSSLSIPAVSEVFANFSTLAQPAQPSAQTPPESHIPWLFLIWSLGAISFAVYLTASNWRFSHKISSRRPLINEPLLNLLEDCKETMGVRAPVTLLETDDIGSPSLFGVIRPRLLLPRGLVNNFSRDEMRFLFLHELAHVKRFDIPVGWLTAILQCAHWFNPFVWLAFHRLRRDREAACDALALSRAAENENQKYGAAILRLLENFGHSTWAPSLAGAIENIDHLKERMKMIALFKNSKSTPALAITLFAVLGLVGFTEAQTEQDSKGSDRAPHIIATSPSIGATEVDPATTEITVTFDRDMSKGMSWTGGGTPFHAAAEGKQAHWRDARTCVLPVKLYSGHYYRVGINAQSYHNFRGADGTPAEVSAIYFTTQGASEALKQKLQTPKIVSLTPANGSHGVSLATTELRVTFDVPMGGGMSWAGEPSDVPAPTDGKSAYWTSDKKTCVLPVTLKPGAHYKLSLNDGDFRNFQSEGGIPLSPTPYTFDTAAQ